MADTYSDIFSRMIDAFTSVISNNLNIEIRKLTIISLIMMVPTFITSFFGMNIPLPFADSGWIGLGVLSVLCLVSSFATRFILQDRPQQQNNMKNRKQIRNFKKAKRDLYKKMAAQEAKLEEMK